MACRAFELYCANVYYVRFLEPASWTRPVSDAAAAALVDEVIDPETVVRISRESQFVVEGHVLFEKVNSHKEFEKNGEFSATENDVVVTVKSKKVLPSPTRLAGKIDAKAPGVIEIKPSGSDQSEAKLPGSYPG